MGTAGTAGMMGTAGTDMRGRIRLGALLGMGCLVLAACAPAGAASTALPERVPAGSAVPVGSAAHSGSAGFAGFAADSDLTGSASGRTAPSPPPTASPKPSGSPEGSASPKPSASIGKSEGTLQLLTFYGHVEYGGALSRANWVAPFERESGCRVVKLDRVGTTEEMAAKLADDAYDVVSPSPELAALLVSEGRVSPVDTGLVPAYKKIPKRLRELPGLRRDGKVYGIPYLWGVNQVVHEGDQPQGPAALYGPAAAAIRDNPLAIADAALALRRSRPELKIDDPFQLTSAQLDAAVELLAERDGPGRLYWRDSLDLIRAMSARSVSVAQATPYHLDLFRRAGRPVKVLDEGPRTGWADSWMLTARPASPNCAYRWLNWMSSPQAQRAAAAWTGLAPANPEACGGRAGRICDLYRVRGGAGLRDVLFATRPMRDCGDGDGECTDYADWVERWKKLVG
ncbi:putative spermidine/putrescine transport system substrate-binding protein [Streptosporangium becharense]|uniref:Putative spermidine/putrescine transport system substrate-binding protein n=1 Tax=Streptosporangium becharense TaxID=1816182 RepID=A0A7W9MFC3_9ACTN|nr:extracellular solute-binding protein [Streptosporangium becharense]MBB2915566.1 putative spermidine/putrescine transport system substrate-binding protein [Streptosporangium becharense]MBB5818907.1 putative spermidine/putrescine transport system substrate-binding protein [Streptosporangium becharense]